MGQYSHAHFDDEETETQKSEVTQPRSQSQQAAVMRQHSGFLTPSLVLFIPYCYLKNRRSGFAEAVLGDGATQLLHGVTEEAPEFGAITLVLAPTSRGTQATIFLQAQLNLTLWKMWPSLGHPYPDQVLS